MDLSTISIQVRGLATYEEETFFMPASNLNIDKMKELSLRSDVDMVMVHCAARVRYCFSNGALYSEFPDLTKFYLDVTAQEQAEWLAIGQ